MSRFFGGFPFGGFGAPRDAGPEEPVDNNRYYELLGVDKNIDCSEVKKVFRKLAMKKHPDKGGDPAEFAEISQAAEVLSDPEKRKIYDRFGEKGIKEGMGAGGAEGMSIFDLLSGRMPGNAQQQRGPKKMDDTLFPLSVTLEDIYNGKLKKVAIKRNRVCSDCNGEGGSKVRQCGECRGQGRVMKMQQLGPGMYTQSVADCDTCAGEGRIVDAKFRCKKCVGKRVIEEKKVLEIQIDRGVPNKYRYTFHGESDEAPGFQAGDLIVEVQEKEHDRFKRKKADLIMQKKITLSEALTGFQFTVTHLDGSVHLVQAQPGEIVKPGDVKTVEELGMPVFKLTYKSGNLFIYFDVDFPPPNYLKPPQMEALKRLLPQPEAMDIDESAFDRANTHKTIEFDKSHITENNTKTYSDHAHEEEEEDPRMMGGRQVRCSGTIF